MRVRRITVKGLFGIFDHEIPLNQEERITIIHGPNGYGKTVMLQLLDALFSETWSFLGSVPFEHFAVEFDDGTTLLCVQAAPAYRGLHSIVLEWRRPGANDPVATFAPMDEPPEEESFANPKIFFPARSQRELERIIDLVRSGSLDDSPYQPTPRWLQELLKQVSLRMIHTQRLESQNQDQPSERIPTVQKYAEELATEIKTTLASYAERSQKLDSSFPTRLFEEPRAQLTIDEIRGKLAALDERRARLTELGFLDPDSDPHRPPPKIHPSKLDVLSVYVEDIEQKLAVFDDLAQRIRLFMEIVNRRFKYKQLTMSKAQGFILTTIQKEPLPLTCLSSGEQHELVLLFELLFKVQEHSLILIDEPEISLHLAWQQHFLSDLGQMVKLSNFDVLLATHSPAIIGKRWDLTVDLKGP